MRKFLSCRQTSQYDIGVGDGGVDGGGGVMLPISRKIQTHDTAEIIVSNRYSQDRPDMRILCLESSYVD